MRRNDWSTLLPDLPALGEWEPRLSVSVVVPAYRAGRLLPTVLAGLAAQTYPAHLLEVVVADDGPDDLELPEVRPERTRVVRVQEGWGRANACHTGALAAEGDVLHWLDADMLAEREHVEAQLRWHHLVDYGVALGHKWFVDPEPVLAASPAEVRDAVAAGGVAGYFDGQEHEPHDWVEGVYERTRDLRDAGPRALRTHVGATASLHRSLYLDAGGMDTSLRLGEDISLGHRLAEAGAFFVPDRQARSWHLGRSHVMEHATRVNAYNDPFLADRVPDLRPKRRPGRSYAVPYLDVVLDTRGQDAARVTTVVDSVLGSTLHDLRVTLLGDWTALTDERRSPLDDPDLATRVVHATYRNEPRVRLLGAEPEGRSDAMWRLLLPSAAWAVKPRALLALLLHTEKTHEGLRQVLLPDGTAARLERTAALARARRLAGPGEDLDDVLDEVAGSAWMAAEDVGFVAQDGISLPRYAQNAGPPLSSDQAWEYVEKQTGRGSRTRRAGRGSEGAPPGPAGPAPGAGSGADRPSQRPGAVARIVRRLRSRSG